MFIIPWAWRWTWAWSTMNALSARLACPSFYDPRFIWTSFWNSQVTCTLSTVYCRKFRRESSTIEQMRYRIMVATSDRERSKVTKWHRPGWSWANYTTPFYGRLRFEKGVHVWNMRIYRCQFEWKIEKLHHAMSASHNLRSENILQMIYTWARWRS
jgi:hypothetical protein